MITSFSRLLIGFGIFLIAAGLLLPYLARIPFIGKLPGDIFIHKGNFTFYFPLVTCLLISFILTFLFSFFGKK
ncbi:MAG: hypothetical protein COV74_10235 [Candidatus Omnitrophica bacterium CG11_big_fil_rev_8_21_14_0_20_45_26]|uniref:DUF2905 domain-containing protein n=1 Tax=Candidatus Abzuiibacterium crystallinum TaxID=1974748 RepID=A0A2H0LKM4_9BACT|nr:MAG: hypothetical protein COV74_10235 [Candidatus Omnitrophica bacterium CG11_big_fil_rev_8_21_14_0_20_45_26]PIW63952.1 MAG: DUF2905 domain-containing protein [Candidatus Omnitrophica bacterium CG12_big_fil_rev_8_21_14_0_65_45_16]